ncbi:phosphonopyruvate decarboxylase [Patescibacteria group bacterium]|nr:phosphonopyruvate decarboxylase [Patescibacteria group bacterium]
MLDPKEFTNFLKSQGFIFFTGVPDSAMKDWLRTLDDEKSIASVNECEALAIAAGYYLGSGKTACLYLQNAGLGKIVNPLTSLCDKEVYSIPALLVIGWRGEPGEKDEPQHIKMGKIILPLLDVLGVPYNVLPDNLEKAKKAIAEAKEYMLKNSAPYAIVVRCGIFGKYNKELLEENKYEMTREEAVKTIVSNLSKDVVAVSTTGKISRELFEYREEKGESHEKDFLTVGSMGCASSIAFGIAQAQPNQKIVIFDGDGAALMQLGTLATIGYCRPKNLLHIIFDNNSYDSTGGQKSISSSVDFQKIALACNYKNSKTINKKIDLIEILEDFKDKEGPSMLVIKVLKGARKELGRPTISPTDNKKNFMLNLASNKRTAIREDFFGKTKIVFGTNSLKNLKDELSTLSARKIFLITGKKSAEKSGLSEKVRKLLSGYEIILFNEVSPSPTAEDIDRCLNVFKESQADIVIGMGGGSVMDVAKVVSVFGRSPYNISDFIKNKINTPENKVPCVTVPTLAGTGAEITPFAVIYHEHKKYSLDIPIVQPNIAIIDLELSVDAPLEISFFPALDALAQAIEAYWAVRSTDESDNYAEEAIKILAPAIDKVMSNPQSRAVRADLARGSLLAGKAIAITRTTAPHALSYPLTIFFKVAHGAATGLLLSYLFSYNYELTARDCQDKRGVKFVKGRLEQLAELLVGEKNIKKATRFLEELISRGPNFLLQDIDLRDIEKLISAVNIQRLNNNPRSLAKEDIEKIYYEIITASIQ